MRLIFCDTFVQEPPDGTVNHTWSAIEFKSPVVLEEIRVIPRGVRLHDQLGAEGQIGNTTPGCFRIDFFACDVSNVDATTFENLCVLEYNETANVSITYPRRPIITEKLLCCGRYAKVTLAVFGAEATDTNAVRLIHERQSNKARNIAQTQVGPPPPDAFQNAMDERRQAPYPNPQFPSGPPLPPINVSPADPQFHDFKEENNDSGFLSNDPSAFQNSKYDSRPYPERQKDSYSYRGSRQRDHYFKQNVNSNQPFFGNDPHQQQRHERQDFNRFPHGQRGYRFPKHEMEWSEETYQDYQHFEDEKKKNQQGSLEMKQEQEQEEWLANAYEEISDEELDEETAANMEAMVAEDMLLPSSMMSFNPFHMEIYPLTHYTSPEVSPFDLLRNKVHVQEEDETKDPLKNLKSDMCNKLDKLVTAGLKLCPIGNAENAGFSGKQDFATVVAGSEVDWVTNLEKVIPLIISELPYLELKAEVDYVYVFSAWSVTALQLDGLIPNLIGVNVRALKAGLALAQRLCKTSADIVEQIAAVHLTDRLLDILHAEHIASSIKILAVHVLDALTDWPSQMHEFTFGEEEILDFNASLKSGKLSKKTTYTSIVELALEPQATRVAYALRQLVRKAHIYECMNEIQVLTQTFVMQKVPEEFAYVSDEETSEDGDFNQEETAEMSAASAEEEEMTSANLEVRNDKKGETKIEPVMTSMHEAQDENPEEQITVGNVAPPSDNSILPIDSVLSVTDVTVTNEELSRIAQCLHEITLALQCPHDTIGQLPVQSFPLSKRHMLKIEANEKDSGAVFLYRMSDGTGLLSSLQALLSLPIVSADKGVFKSCSLLLEELMQTKQGLLHLLSNSDCVIHIIQHLLKSSPQLDVETPGTAGHLGVKLAFHVHAMQSIDHISSLLDSEAEEEDVEEELNHAFKVLFSLTYPHFGKQYVSDVLAKDDLLKPILHCLWFPGLLSDPDPQPVLEEKTDEEKKSSASDVEKSAEEESEEKKEAKAEPIQHRSAVNSYASALVHFLLMTSNNVGYIYKHIDDITRSCMSDLHILSRSDSMKRYLIPLEKKLCGKSSDIQKLVEFIKEKSALLEWTSLTIDGPGICMALRLLCHLCFKGDEGIQETDAASRLKVLELFSVDALNILLTLGDQLHKSLHYFCHGIRVMAAGMNASTHNLIIAVCDRLFSLLHFMLHQALDSSMDCKNVNHTHITQTVVALYSDAYVLLRPIDTALLHAFTKKTVSILSLFFAHSKCTEISNTVTTEIIKYAETQCDNFVPTLTLLSQLLPMPLPIATPCEPPHSARTIALSTCKLWNTCMAPHIDSLIAFLLPLSSSTCRPLVEVVIVLVQQLIDLSPSLALAVVKKYMDGISPVLVSTAVIKEEEKNEKTTEDSIVEKEPMLSPEQVTLIQIFSEILTLPTAKAAFISQLYSRGEGMMNLWKYSSNPQTPPEDVAAVLLFVSVLLDTSFSLFPVTDELQSLADCFPATDHIKAISKLVIEQVKNPSCLVSSRAFLVFSLLLNTRFSVPYIRNVILEREENFSTAVELVNEKFDPSSTCSSDALFNALGCIFLLLELKTAPVNKRKENGKYSLSKPQLRYLLDLKSDPEKNVIMMMETKLQKLISEENYSDESTIGMFDQLTSLRQSLAAENAAQKFSKLEELELPKPTSLKEQYSDRPVFIIGREDPSLFVQLSLTAPCFNTKSTVGEQRVVQCDLIATAEELCQGYDLAEQLGKLAKAVDVQRVAEETEAMAKRRQKMETYSARLGKSLTFMKRSHGLLMAQQQQQRGRGRGRGNPTNRPFDLFRHRKQNTSRPPSMHVDDFVAADEEQEKNGSEEPLFKPPPSPLPPLRRPPIQSFKPREFTPRGGRGGNRGSRNNNYRGRGNFSSYQGSSASPVPFNKFRPRTSSADVHGGRFPERFRGMSSRPPGSRLSFSPRDGYKTNKQEQGNWGGQFNRDHSGGSPFYRGRGSKTRGGHSFNSPWRGGSTSAFPRRGRLYNKTRGKHMRSNTR